MIEEFGVGWGIGCGFLLGIIFCQIISIMKDFLEGWIDDRIRSVKK